MIDALKNYWKHCVDSYKLLLFGYFAMVLASFIGISREGHILFAFVVFLINIVLFWLLFIIAYLVEKYVTKTFT